MKRKSRRKSPLFWLVITVLALPFGSVSTDTQAAASREINLLFLQQTLPERPLLSNIRTVPVTEGLDGAKVAIADNNTTGRFTGDHYTLESEVSDSPEQLIQSARQWLAKGNRVILAKLPSSTLLALASSPEIEGRALIFNISNPDDSLRYQDCRPRLLHTMSSRAMLTDALAQFLIARRWNKWLLLRGQYDDDKLYAAALKRAAKRFGGKIIDERVWDFDTDLRRTAHQELRSFTRGKDYDITLVADERGDFGEYVPYNTWLARPVAGTQGLMPTAWHWSIEQWGAVQLQNRFHESANRPMRAADYAAWLAVRAVGEAVTRNRSDDADALLAYLLGSEFQLAAFKGRGLTFRGWNGQLRQPIALVQPNALISQSPQEGYLHPKSEMDTLGYDKPEVQCSFAAQ